MSKIIDKIKSLVAADPSDGSQKKGKNGTLLLRHNLPETVTTLQADIRAGMQYMLHNEVNAILDRFMLIAYGFPSSDEFHHTTYLGNLEHSLGVAARMIKSIEGKGPRQMRLRRFYALVCGLGHDLGKCAEWVILTRGVDCNPLIDSMAQFTGHWERTAKREGIWHKNSSFTSILMVNRLLGLDDAATAKKFAYSDLYDAAELNDCLEAIGLHHMPPPVVINPYLRALLVADHDDVAESRGEKVNRKLDVVSTGVIFAGGAPGEFFDPTVFGPSHATNTNAATGADPDIPTFEEPPAPAISPDDKARILPVLAQYMSQPASGYYVGASPNDMLVLVEPFGKQSGSRKLLSHFIKSGGFASDADFLAVLAPVVAIDSLDEKVKHIAFGKEQEGKLLIIDLLAIDPEAALPDNKIEVIFDEIEEIDTRDEWDTDDF